MMAISKVKYLLIIFHSLHLYWFVDHQMIQRMMLIMIILLNNWRQKKATDHTTSIFVKCQQMNPSKLRPNLGLNSLRLTDNKAICVYDWIKYQFWGMTPHKLLQKTNTPIARELVFQGILRYSSSVWVFCSFHHGTVWSV